MAFVKNIKDRSYFKRFQTKFRRRREGKTDYYARRNMIMQDLNKYNTPKYRFVVRITSTKVITQIIYATVQGDRVLAQALSTELKRYGLDSGLTNYSAAYATGLLLARRLLKQTGLADIYKGAKAVNGEDYDVAAEIKEDQRKPFKAVLDAGLVRTTTGARVFGAMKGACDGGLQIPHSVKRFPGFSAAGSKETYDAKKHRERIFGVHVQNYMKALKEEGDDDFKRQFSRWSQTLQNNKVDSVEKLYQKVHDDIRKNPEKAAAQKKEQKAPKFVDPRKTIVETAKGKYKKERRLTRDERKARVTKKIQIAAGKAK